MITAFKKSYAGRETIEVLKKRILVDGFRIVMDLKKSKNAWVHNQVDGQKYLSFYSFFASLPIGFNHPGLKNRAYQRALLEAAQAKVTLSDVYSPHYARFVDVLDRVALRRAFRYFFFVEGGALAVENALKVAFDWKTRVNQKRGKKTEADQVIHFTEAFHGRSGYTLSLTNTHDRRKTEFFPKFLWPRFPAPKIHIYEEEDILPTVEEREARAVRLIESHLKRSATKTAAILIEPIQAEGGDNHFRGVFLKQLRRLADKYEVLLIFDEVQTGLGLTGKWWCWEHFGIKPDILCFAKKTQTGGIAVTDRIDRAGIEHCFRLSSRINSTFGGNLCDMVRATRYIEIIREYDLLDNITRRGLQALQALTRLSQTFPLTNVRGRGGMIAFDAPSETIRDRIVKTAMEKECLIILPCGKRSLRLRPALSMTEEEVAEGVLRLEKTLRRIFF